MAAGTRFVTEATDSCVIEMNKMNVRCTTAITQVECRYPNGSGGDRMTPRSDSGAGL